MSNVVPLKPRGRRSVDDVQAARETAAIVGELVEAIASIRTASERAAGLSRPPLRVERTVQHLLDAITAAEAAMEALTDDGDYVPF